MFFKLSKNKDIRFPNHAMVGSWILSFDDGWNKTENDSWYKGFQHLTIDHGLWTEIREHAGIIQLLHGKCRGYPLWWDAQDQVLTNLQGKGQILWSDDQVTLDQEQLHIKKSKILPDPDLTTRSRSQVVDLLRSNLLEKVGCLQDDYPFQPKKLFLSGGIDTLLILGLCKNKNIDVEIIDYEYFQYDYFTNYNIEEIKKNYWAYTQLHHWTKDTLFLTGSCGDEYLFRGPTEISIWAAWHDIDLCDMLSSSNGYHAGYFKKQSNFEIIQNAFKNKNQIKEQWPDKKSLINQILNINANEYQHWHLGKTLTWTPFLDLNLTNLMVSLDPRDLIDQILDAGITKELLCSLDSELINLLSNTKNYNSRRNLINAKL